MPLTRNASFRQLATFHAVARLGSVSAAAEEMHLTQPAVSIQIGILEESALTPLLQRSGRGVRLTEAGELLANYAGRILDLWREAGEEMATLQGVFAGAGAEEEEVFQGSRGRISHRVHRVSRRKTLLTP